MAPDIHALVWMTAFSTVLFCLNPGRSPFDDETFQFARRVVRGIVRQADVMER